MGLIVPILRLLYVALNVYDTFKTLKPSPPSSRNGGQPTVRALSQRKRAMKGCLAIWLVWCCYAAYERSLDGIIGMFIPFYSEMKALLILFFLLTRARGAEPIYLHILRPLVKPYAATLDAVLDFIQTAGDLVLLLCALPFHLLSSFYHRWISRKTKPAATEESKKDEKQAEVPADEQGPAPSEYGKTRSRKRALHEAHAKASGVQPSVQAKVPASRKVAPEVWRPPPSAYEESPPKAPVGLPTPPAELETLAARNQYVDEWRQYEGIPSAYPVTPPHSVSGLPPSNYGTPLSSFTAATVQASAEITAEGFHRSLKSQRESQNQDYEDDLSDDMHENLGVHTDEEMSVEEDYEDEDDFNVTLQTPYPLSRIMNVSDMTAATDDSMALDTFDEDSPLQTRTNSQGSHYSLADVSPSMRKRRLPSPVPSSRSSLTVTRPKTPEQETIRAKPAPTRATIRPPLASRKISRGEEASAGSNEDTSSVVKKQRAEVSIGARKTNVRPLSTKQEENKAPPRKVPVSTTARAPLRTTARPAQKPVLTKEPVRRRPADAVKDVPATAPPTEPVPA